MSGQSGEFNRGRSIDLTRGEVDVFGPLAQHVADLSEAEIEALAERLERFELDHSDS